jgi:DNA-binding IclR family transcriptional regulator
MDATLLKGLHLLEWLALREQPAGVTEIAGALNWPKSNVHRQLRTLVAAGFVTTAAGPGRYACSLKLWSLGSAVLARLDLARPARPHMLALSQATRETVNLAVLEGVESLYIDKIDSPLPVRADTRVGVRAPLYCSATGKAMLAHSPEAIVAAACAAMQRHTGRTRVSRAALEVDLQQARRRGFAVTRGEWREGVVGIAAAIPGPGGRVMGAIGIGGPAERIPERRVAGLGAQVRLAASRIGAALGSGALAGFQGVP